jgi:short-subunit dehydrogenase
MAASTTAETNSFFMDPNLMTRTALVTGASSGIGEAFADVFAGAGWDLVITARREDRLRAVAERLERQHGRRVHVITADLALRDAPARLCEQIAARGIAVDALVNNAGYGVSGSYVKNTWAEHDTFIQVMVTAVAELTHHLLPPMIERGYGRIVNVASLAGLVPPGAGHTLYAASKAFLIRFSESLAQEVRHHGVHVTALCPGFTFSEFHDVLGTRQMMNKLPSFMWLDAPTVAHQGYDAVMAGKPVHVTGMVNSAIATLVRVLPYGLVTAVNRRVSQSYRKV